MNNQQHTPEPWRVFTVYAHPEIRDADDAFIAALSTGDVITARRIVACVNACAGIPTEFLEREQYLGTASFALRDRLEKQRDGLLGKLEWHIDEIKLLNRHIDELNARKFGRFGNEDCWIYQGDGEDHLESLVCPVVISPSRLIELIKQRDELLAALEVAIDTPELQGGKWEELARAAIDSVKGDK